MVNLKGLVILLLLIVAYCCVISNAVCESYTNSKSKKSKPSSIDKEDCGCGKEPTETSEMEHVESQDVISSSESEVSEPIVLRDSVRRESKVGSSLDFTYLDENCDKIVKPMHHDYPIERIPETEPITPIINNSDRVPVSNDASDYVNSGSSIKELKEDPFFNSEMFDDSELKPKPDMDSPYGFVYFPNKYWKQWHQKAPICTPTSKCKVLPTYTHGAPVDVLDYTQIGSMMPKFEYKEEYEEVDVCDES
tara:strand:+ start:3871 stop:4620 length:750 start_codon:yes stop_codon:yes gene_type:complete